MIAIVKVVAVGAALSGAPAPHPGTTPSPQAGAPVIRLDQVPTKRLLPFAPATKLAVASHGRASGGAASPGCPGGQAAAKL